MKEFELEPGEHVVKELRKHWFVFLVELIPYAILALLPFALPHFELILGANLPSLNWSDPIVHVFVGLYLLVVWCGAFKLFTRYFLNLWVLTNQRIVDAHQYGFFNREVSSLLLNRVQDVTVDTKGIMASLLDIGTINVQSAGAVDRFSMGGIPHPAKMRDIILAYVETKSAGQALV